MTLLSRPLISTSARSKRGEEGKWRGERVRRGKERRRERRRERRKERGGEGGGRREEEREEEENEEREKAKEGEEGKERRGEGEAKLSPCKQWIVRCSPP